MTTTILNAPISTINNRDFQQFRTKHPEAFVRIDLVMNTLMDESQFWDIIAMLDWGRKRNDDIVAPAIKALSEFSETDICKFEDILAQKLYAIDGEKYASTIWPENPTQENLQTPFSVDVFLYARCCAVANGKKFYDKVVDNPVFMPISHTFEPLLYIEAKAYKLKSGTDNYDYLPKVSYETFSNTALWPGKPSLRELLLGTNQ
jgi:hypothetical protein